MPALVRNFHRKDFKFGDVKIATANDAEDNLIYEIVYVELFDDAEKTNGSVTSQVDITDANVNLTIDTDQFKASTNIITIDQLVRRFLYPNSVSNMQQRLRELIPAGDSTIININEKFIPLWMSSTQTTGTALGYTKAVPIAYAKPGFGATILENIQNSGFDFKNINFEVDRLTIDSVEGEAGDKYIVFPKRKVI